MSKFSGLEINLTNQLRKFVSHSVSKIVEKVGPILGQEVSAQLVHSSLFFPESVTTALKNIILILFFL